MIKLEKGKYFFEILYSGPEKTSRVHYLSYKGDSGWEINKEREFLGILCLFNEDGKILPTKIRGDYKDKVKQAELQNSIKELKELLNININKNSIES